MKEIIEEFLVVSNRFVINATTGKDTLQGTADDWYADKFIGLFSDCEPTKQQEVALIERTDTVGITYKEVFKLFKISFDEISLTINQIIDFCKNNIAHLPRVTGFLCKTSYGFYLIYVDTSLPTYSFHLRGMEESSCVTNFIIQRAL